MPAIIIPDRWDKKPSGIPFIDWSNPITTGLRYFVLLDAARFNINLVTQALLGGVLEPGVVLSKESITTAATALGKLQLDISKSSWVGTYAVSSIHLSGTVDWMFASNTAWDGLYTDGTNVNLTSNLGFGGTGAPVGEKKNTRFSRVCVAIPSANDFRSISGTGPVSVDTSAALPIGAMTKVFFGSDYSGANHAAAEVEYFAIWDRVLPDAEMRAFNAAPYQVVKKPSRILYFPSAGGGGATGTLAATESGSDTAALTGDVLIDGALAATESGSDTAALTGDVIVQGALAVTESGTDTAAATGLVLVQGALAATESGSDTAALAGLVLVQGSIASVEPGADTASIAGDVLVSGALAASETGSDTAAFTGDASLGIFGSIDAAESGSDSAQVTGLVLIQGGLAVTETGSDTAAITGPAAVSGSIAATETGSDTAAVTGLVLIYGSLATTETGSDTAAVSSFRPTVPGIEYTLPEGKAHYTLPDGRAHYTIAA